MNLKMFLTGIFMIVIQLVALIVYMTPDTPQVSGIDIVRLLPLIAMSLFFILSLVFTLWGLFARD